MAYTAKDDLQYASDAARLSRQNMYTPSANVTDAQAELQRVSAGKPAEYTSENAELLGGLYEKMVQREAFSYDASKDSAFQDYRAKYMTAGQLAAKDTAGNNRLMAGGYGDVWTKAAANEQYGEYLKGVNDALPLFEQNAYERYQAEGDLARTQLGAAKEKDEGEYRRRQDEYGQWVNDRDFAANRAQAEYQKDYRMYADNMQNAMKMIGYGREDDEIVRGNAYKMSVELLKNGIMPIQVLLDRAGIRKSDAKRLAVKNGYRPEGDGGHGKKRAKKSGSSGQTKDGSWFIAGERMK